MENSEPDSLYLENLDEFVNDENKIVTYKWLSQTLQVNVNRAKRMLYEFVQQQRNDKSNDNLNVTYLVSGVLKVTSDQTSDIPVHILQILPEDQWEVFKTSCSLISSRHIYSVQRALIKDPNVLYQAEYETRQENILNCAKYSSIKCEAAKLRAVDQLPIPSKPPVKITPNSNKNGTNTSKPAPKKAKGIAGMFANAKKSEAKGEMKTMTIKQEPSTKSGKDVKPKPGKPVSSFFVKQEAKPIQKKAPCAADVPKKVSKDVSTTSGKKKKAEESSGESDVKPDKKRRRVREIIESSSEEDEMDDAPIPSPRTIANAELESSEDDAPMDEGDSSKDNCHFVPDTPDPKSSQKASQVKKAHESTVDSSLTNTEEKSPSKHSQNSAKRRKRSKKLVSKTTLDEDGFMVTEKVWETNSTDASSDEDIEPSKSSSTKKSLANQMVKDKKPKASKPKKTSPKATGNAKQMSLTSFFKKK